MKKYIFFSLLILCIILYASFALTKDYKLSKDDFIQRVSNGSIALDRAPLFSVPPAVLDKLSTAQKSKYPNFREAMWFVHYLKTNDWMYSIFYEWPSKRCLLRIELLDKKTGKPNEKTLDPNGQEIDKKVCEQLYGLSL